MLSSVVTSIVLVSNLFMLDFSTFYTPEMAAEGIVPAAPAVDPICKCVLMYHTQY